jgi:CelD/BcsL family acetyltransferase involved in cellulose biosynthesis
MADQTTCGQGLAERSALLAQLRQLSASLADNLEAHTEALDLSDKNAKKEHAVYLLLVQQHRAIAGQLEAVGEEMAGYHALPMGKHDPEALSSPRVVAAFERYVKVEEELLALLQELVEQDQTILADMRRSDEEADPD